MLGTVFHYAVVEPKADHADCPAQVAGIIAYHERIGYRQGGAYNGHFCIHGGIWISYLGPNQATGDTWANLNLHAWCYLATVDTPVTTEAAQAAYDLTLVEPTGRDQIYPHSAFYQTSCCGDPLRAWIAAGALAPVPPPPAPPEEEDDMAFTCTGPDGQNWHCDGVWRHPITWDQANLLATLVKPVPYNGAADQLLLDCYQIAVTSDASSGPSTVTFTGTGTLA